jgi:OmpA-OmpF porin, OOP family
MKHTLVLIVWLACFSVWAQEISPRYELVKMNDRINTLYHQVSPVISIDGTKLYYFVSNHPQNTFGKENSQDIWVSTLDNKGEWCLMYCKMVRFWYEVVGLKTRKGFQL